MWAFLALPGGGVGFETWEFGRTKLVAAGLGCDYPEGFAAYLAARGIADSEFRCLLMHTTEVLYGSLFGAADNQGSLQDLAGLAASALAAGAEWPELRVFADSQWIGDGWGGRPNPEQLLRWRSAEHIGT